MPQIQGGKGEAVVSLLRTLDNAGDGGSSAFAQLGLPAIMCECFVCISHFMRIFPFLGGSASVISGI